MWRSGNPGGSCVGCWAKPGLAGQKPSGGDFLPAWAHNLCSFPPHFDGDFHPLEHRGTSSSQGAFWGEIPGFCCSPWSWWLEMLLAVIIFTWERNKIQSSLDNEVPGMWAAPESLHMGWPDRK